jgi:hypothetical protein
LEDQTGMVMQDVADLRWEANRSLRSSHLEASGRGAEEAEGGGGTVPRWIKRSLEWRALAARNEKTFTIPGTHDMDHVMILVVQDSQLKFHSIHVLPGYQVCLRDLMETIPCVASS